MNAGWKQEAALAYVAVLEQQQDRRLWITRYLVHALQERGDGCLTLSRLPYFALGTPQRGCLTHSGRELVDSPRVLTDECLNAYGIGRPLRTRDLVSTWSTTWTG